MTNLGGEEIGQWLRARGALAQDLSLVPNTHIEQLTTLPVFCAPGHPTPTADLHGKLHSHLHTPYRHIHVYIILK